jgi:hypothetical protein
MSLDDLPLRLQRKIVVDDNECWLWCAATTPTGYGISYLDGRTLLAHRVTWILLVGPIPESLTVDHLCRVRRCVNPSHCELVTRAENIRRGANPRIVAHHTNTCLRGHDMTDAYVRPNGLRHCRRCKQEYERRRYHERKV